MPHPPPPSRPFHRRVRSQLLLPALFVGACLAGLAIVRSTQRRSAQLAEQKTKALELVRTTIRGLDGTVSEAQTLLTSVATLLDPAASTDQLQAMLQRVLDATPTPYERLWLIQPDGLVLRADRRSTAADARADDVLHASLRDALTIREFSVGPVASWSVVPGAPRSVRFSLPVRDSATRQLRAVIGASLRLDSIDVLRRLPSLPHGSVLTILDTTSTVIFRTLDPEHWQGRRFANEYQQLRRNFPNGSVSAGLSDDGTERLIGFDFVRRAPWVLFIGIPAKFTVDLVRNQFLVDVGIGTLITLVLVGLGVRSALRVVGPIESLTRDARAIADGDMSQRSTVQSDDEIGDLSRAFNQMADTIVARGEALESSQAQLLHAQKMEALGSFAGGIAHDFNNHLHAIVGFAQLAADAVPPGSDADADIQSVLQSAGRAADLTRQILVFSRKQRMTPTLIDLRTVVSGIQRMLGRIVGDDRTCTVDATADPLPVLADQGQLEQVIVNLVANARDATAPGGQIHVGLSASEVAADGARHAILTVSDDGVGMNATTQARIFDPFFSTKARAEGTGLGLAMAHGIVVAAGGSITVESAPGHGATFRVTLPLIAGDMPRQPSASPVDTPTVRGGRILLAEDDEAVRSATTRMLQRAGFEVMAGSDGPTVLRLHEASPEPFDLLLTDVAMPGMRGPELASRVTARDPAIAVLFMSGYADDGETSIAAGPRVPARIAKPFTYATLIAAVAAALEARARTFARP